MSTLGNHRTSVSTLMGVAVLDAQGKAFGRVREFAVAPQVDSGRVEALVLRLTGDGRRAKPSLVAISSLELSEDGRLKMVAGAEATVLGSHDDYLLLERDLLDQQIIDVNGHKVVRVNDVDLVWEHPADADAETGRGLLLVTSLSADWGFYRTPGGKAVYFTLQAQPDVHGNVIAAPQGHDPRSVT